MNSFTEKVFLRKTDFFCKNSEVSNFYRKKTILMEITDVFYK